MKHKEQESTHPTDPEIDDNDIDDDDLDDPDYDIDRYGFDVSPNGDGDRYVSARGWQPPDPHKKARDKYRKEHPEQYCTDTLFETKPANEWLKGQAPKPAANLFGDMWRTGELAVLAGETGVGKSILAIQIAETVARGAAIEHGKVRRANSSENSQPNSQLAPAQPVLYLDLERSADQFKQRYSCPSPIPGKLPVKYRFSPQLRRAAFGDFEIPSEFRGDLSRYFDHSLDLTLAGDATTVIVIDNLSCLDPRGDTRAAVRRMRSLKLYAAETGASILVMTHLKPRAPRRNSHSSSLIHHPLAISEIADIAQIADSVFAIGRSTFGDDIRYIKPLKSNATPLVLGLGTSDPGHQVIAARLERSEGVGRARVSRPRIGSPHVSKGLSSTPEPAEITESIFIPMNPSSSLIPHRSSLPLGPFLGFTFLGPSNESDHLRDYAREALDARRADKSGFRRLHSSKDILVDGILDGSYERYLKR